jgi:hypothetical protein
MPEWIPAPAFLAPYPAPMREIAETLREVVRRAMPEALERVRVGWHLIGYDIPAGKGTRYFAYVAPETEHVHLGFEHGVSMADPDARLEGAGITRQVRWLTFRSGDPIDAPALAVLVREAARVARLSRADRLAAALDRDVGPPRVHDPRG